MIREKIKDLWRLCFNDSDEFVNMYFELRYNNEVNIAIESGEEVIAALQMLPYPMTFGEAEINTAYVSGACTHPDYRNRGVMHELLSQAFVRMLHKDVALSTLIPAEPWLFGYYARNGYATAFSYSRHSFNASERVLPQADGKLREQYSFAMLGETDATSDSAQKEEAYAYLNRKLRERRYCIQHTPQDFKVILADLQLGGGHVFTLSRAGKIAALAIAYPGENGRMIIGELVSDTAETEHLLLLRICGSLGLRSVEILAPPLPDGHNRTLGMARIINAKAILQLYAASHPEAEFNISLTDEQISTNNGYYYLSNGKCMNSAKRLPGSHLALTIGELTEKIIAPLNPYMSLMLN